MNAAIDHANAAKVDKPFEKTSAVQTGGPQECPDLLGADSLHANRVELLGQLAGGVVHDFNNLLGAMMMQVNLLQAAEELPPGVAVGLKEIEALTTRAAGVTRQFLLFSRKQKLEKARVDLNVVLAGVHKMLGRLIGEDISFELNVAPEPLWVEADAGMVEQVLMNLCVNARDAMPRGGRLVIESRLEHRGPSSHHPGRFACLAVTDTGSGMDQVTRSHIFEPFFTTKPSGKGTGLGLSTVYGIVKMHLGWVDVESAPGCGSTFRAYFPFVESAGPTPVPVIPAVSRGGSESVLLVEDDSAIRGMVMAMLQRAGYRVAEAASSTEAIRKWYENRYGFDLLLTDFLLPGGRNGVQLAEKFTMEKPSLRAIVMSGYSSTPGGAQITLPERTVRLSKPFRTSTLLDAVRQCFDAGHKQA